MVYHARYACVRGARLTSSTALNSGIVTPSLDNGSSWYTVSRGHVSTAGVLTLRVANGTVTDQRIV